MWLETEQLLDRLIRLQESLSIPSWTDADREIAVGVWLMCPTEGAKATCSLRAPTTVLPISLFSGVFTVHLCIFPFLGSTHSHSAQKYVWLQQAFLSVWDTKIEVHSMCRNESARCAHLSQQTKKKQKKKNTSFGGTQQVGDRGRDARVSDGYLPFTVAVEWCQPTTHSKRICNANESARLPSGWSNLCSVHKVDCPMTDGHTVKQAVRVWVCCTCVSLGHEVQNPMTALLQMWYDPSEEEGLCRWQGLNKTIAEGQLLYCISCWSNHSKQESPLLFHIVMW